MIRHQFFAVSLFLALAAIGATLAALWQFSRAAQTVARSASGSEAERSAAGLEVGRYHELGTAIGYAGAVFAVSSLGFLILSARRREPARRSATVALLACYVLLQGIMVVALACCLIPRTEGWDLSADGQPRSCCSVNASPLPAAAG